MSNIRSTIEDLASQFASSVLDALRGASLDELADISRTAGTERGAVRGAVRGRPRSVTASPVESETSAPAAGRKNRVGRLGRRSPDDITKMVQDIVDLLSSTGTGLRAEQIRTALDVEAKELPRPLAEAISAGRITKSGQKRATTYFADGGSDSAPKRRGRKPAAPGRKKR